MKTPILLLALCVFGMIAFVGVVSHLQTRGHGAVWSGLRTVAGGRALRALVAVELVWGAGLVGVELLSGPRLAELFGNAEDGVVTLGVTAAAAWTISGAGSAATGWLVRRCGSPARSP